MTIGRLMLVVAIAQAALSSACADRKERSDASKVDLAKIVVRKYAFEAFPSWAMAHPSKDCPAKLEDLDEYIANADAKDPWGTPYNMMCGKDLPAGARGFAVSSAGPDRKPGTADDIKSWQ